jgi:hypothetical protein
MSVSVEDLIGRAKPPVRSVTICMDQSMQAEHDELIEQLEQAQRAKGSKMGDSSEAVGIANRIGEVEAAMQEHLQTFHFKGLSKHALQALYKRFPSENKNLLWDMDGGGHALVAAAATDPVISEDQAKRLFDAISDGQADLLVGAAWLASKGSSSIPLSGRASELRRGNA